LEIFWKIMAMMGIAFWAGLFWRRATAAGAWASTLVSFATWMFTDRIDLIGWDFNARLAHHLPDFMLWQGELSLPWQMIIYLVMGLIAMVLVSLVTKPHDKKELDRLYECIRTPVEPGEPEVEPLTLPEGRTPNERTVLVKHSDFEIMKPSLISVIGFVGSWVAVGLLIASFFWILK
jgi:Na+/proline symporter